MILDKIVKVNIVPFTLKYYNNLGYNVKIKDIIEIPVEYLPDESHKLVKVKCDFCGNEKDIMYRHYIENISTQNKYTCSQKCAHAAGKNKKTCLNMYGDENYNNIEKSKQTNLELYGVKNVFQIDKIKELSKQTKEEKYGNKNYNNRKKFLETMKDRWESIIKKIIINTNLEKYGVEFPLQSELIQNKCNQTLLKNYGVKNPMQNKEIVDKLFEIRFGITHDEYLEQLPDFKRYRNEVLKITRKQPLNILNNYNKRGLRDYHLDHKFSISEGFKQNIPPYIIGNINNLIMLPWKDNLSKNYTCSLTKEELFILL